MKFEDESGGIVELVLESNLTGDSFSFTYEADIVSCEIIEESVTKLSAIRDEVFASVKLLTTCPAESEEALSQD
ncbi:hypothetical protein BH10PSE7_BH10PSE7_17940 [soil metagenome]